MAQHLNSLGIRAELAERGRPEERLGTRWYQRKYVLFPDSLGVIDVRDGLVRWINIVKYGSGHSRGNTTPMFSVIFGIPDERPFSKHKAVNIETVEKRRLVLGKVVDVTWRGKDHHTGLAEVFSSDDAVKALAKRFGGHLWIRSYAREFHGWTLAADHLRSGYLELTTGPRSGKVPICLVITLGGESHGLDSP